MSKIAIVGVIAVAALAVPVVMQYQTITELRKENADLKAQVAQIAPLQEQVARAQQDAATVGSSAEAQVRELARLRGEVQQLRSQTQTQTNVLAKAQQQLQSLQERMESEAEARRTQAAAARTENQEIQRMNACINNLRLIDAAKQQWALENKKGAADTPTMDDLRPYIGRGPNGELPTCPDNGVYTVGTVAEKPTCSYIGHVLP